jgi:hypothetical protein
VSALATVTGLTQVHAVSITCVDAIADGDVHAARMGSASQDFRDRMMETLTAACQRNSIGQQWRNADEQ